MNKVLTYAMLNDAPKIKLTKSQIEALRKAKLWPHDSHSGAYASIGKPFSQATPPGPMMKLHRSSGKGFVPLCLTIPAMKLKRYSGSEKSSSDDASRAEKSVRAS